MTTHRLTSALRDLWMHYVPPGTPVRIVDAEAFEDYTRTRTTSAPWIAGDDVLVHVAAQSDPVSVCDLEVDVDLCECLLTLARVRPVP